MSKAKKKDDPRAVLARRVAEARQHLAEQDETDYWALARLTYETVKATPGPPEQGEITHRQWSELLGISLSYSKNLRVVWAIGLESRGFISFTDALLEATEGRRKFPEPGDPMLAVRTAGHPLLKAMSTHPEWIGDESLADLMSIIAEEAGAWGEGQRPRRRERGESNQ